MITILSFTIHGNAKQVRKRADLFMTEIGKTVGITINEITCLVVKREDTKLNLKQFRKKLIREMSNDKSN